MCIGDPVPSPQKGGYGMGGVLELMKLTKGWGLPSGLELGRTYGLNSPSSALPPDPLLVVYTAR